jgi:hypothetical protein
MKTYWWVEVYHPAFWTSALDGSRWSASRRGRFNPEDRAYGTHWTEGWLGGLQGQSVHGDEEKQSNIFSCRELNPGRPARSLITTLYELYCLLDYKYFPLFSPKT